MNQACRLLVDPPAGGAWNMAVDDVLLQSAAQEGTCSLRFYEWSQPTLSLGYFQPFRDRAQHPASSQCAIVRRSTGGGAILHHHELTYSIALPSSHPAARRSLVLYQSVHGCLVEALRALGIVETLAIVSSQPRNTGFLCFERRAVSDVTLGEGKICGSAQRRTGGAVLQHGSVLLRQSIFAPELPGLVELSHRPVASADLRGAWQARLSRQLQLELKQHTLIPEEVKNAEQVVLSRYAADSWLRRR